MTKKITLNFDVYIGHNICNSKNENIVARVRYDQEGEIYIPHRYDANGSERDIDDYFDQLRILGNYFADWCSNAEKLGVDLKATIYLNVKSLKKVYSGRNIFEIIDRIDGVKNWEDLRSFDF